MRRSMLAIVALALALPAAAAGGAAAATAAIPVEIAADRPSATVRGTVAGGAAVRYRVRVGDGQRLAATLAMDDPRGTLVLRAPAGDAVLFDGAAGGRIGDVVVGAGGDHVVEVALRGAAAGDGPAPFTLTIEVTGGDPGAVTADFADGLAGGPDFLAVAGLAPGRRLNLRDRPSTAGAIVARLAVGTVLRNRGCRMTGSTRWCRIERPDGRGGGWAVGRFLIEAPGPDGPAEGEGTRP